MTSISSRGDILNLFAQKKKRKKDPTAEADYADPISSFRFWSGRKIEHSRAKSKQASCAGIRLGSCFFCSCDSAVRFWDSENSTSTTATFGAAPSALRSLLLSVYSR